MSTFKNLQKIRESFRNIVLGLLDNKDLEAVNCLIFIYGIVMDKLDIGVNTRKQRNTLKKDEESIFIVPVAPKRTGAVAKTSQVMMIMMMMMMMILMIMMVSPPASTSSMSSGSVSWTSCSRGVACSLPRLG